MISVYSSMNIFLTSNLANTLYLIFSMICNKAEDDLQREYYGEEPRVQAGYCWLFPEQVNHSIS